MRLRALAGGRSGEVEALERKLAETKAEYAAELAAARKALAESEETQLARVRASEKQVAELREREAEAKRSTAGQRGRGEEEAAEVGKRLRAAEAARAEAEGELGRARAAFERASEEARARLEEAQRRKLGAVVSTAGPSEGDSRTRALEAEVSAMREDLIGTRASLGAAERDKAGLARQLSATLEKLADTSEKLQDAFASCSSSQNLKCSDHVQESINLLSIARAAGIELSVLQKSLDSCKDAYSSELQIAKQIFLESEKIQVARLHASETLLNEFQSRQTERRVGETENINPVCDSQLGKRMKLIENAKAEAENQLSLARSSFQNAADGARVKFEQEQQRCLGAIVSATSSVQQGTLDTELQDLRRECGTLRGSLWQAERDKAGLARQLSVTLNDLAAVRDRLSCLPGEGTVMLSKRLEWLEKSRSLKNLMEEALSSEDKLLFNSDSIAEHSAGTQTLSESQNKDSFPKSDSVLAQSSRNQKFWRPTRADWRNQDDKTNELSVIRQERMSDVIERTKNVRTLERAESLLRAAELPDARLSQSTTAEPEVDWKSEFGKLLDTIHCLQDDIMTLDSQLQSKQAECEKALAANSRLVEDLAAAHLALADYRMQASIELLEKEALADFRHAGSVSFGDNCPCDEPLKSTKVQSDACHSRPVSADKICSLGFENEEGATCVAEASVLYTDQRQSPTGEGSSPADQDIGLPLISSQPEPSCAMCSIVEVEKAAVINNAEDAHSPLSGNPRPTALVSISSKASPSANRGSLFSWGWGSLSAACLLTAFCVVALIASPHSSSLAHDAGPWRIQMLEQQKPILLQHARTSAQEEAGLLLPAPQLSVQALEGQCRTHIAVELERVVLLKRELDLSREQSAGLEARLHKATQDLLRK